MKLETKKLIAREFLLLLISVGLGLIGFILTLGYSFIKESQLNNLQNEIILNESNNQKLNNSYDKKYETRAWFYNTINEKFDLSNSSYNDPDKLWKRLNILIQKDSLRYKYEQSPDIRESFKIVGLTNIESVEKFIQQNNLTKAEISDINKYVQDRKFIESLNSKASEAKSNTLSDSKKNEFTLWLFLCVLIFIFPIRYLYYSIKWSSKILKQS